MSNVKRTDQMHNSALLLKTGTFLKLLLTPSSYHSFLLCHLHPSRFSGKGGSKQLSFITINQHRPLPPFATRVIKIPAAPKSNPSFAKQQVSMADLFLGNPFRRFLWGPTVLREWQGSSAGSMDWIETPSSHLLKFNVPGYGKDQIKIQLEEDNVLSIRSEGLGAKEEAPKDSVWHVSERGKGEFARNVVLPESVRFDQIKAQVENGVLTIVLPKEPAPAKPKTRAIPVSSKL